MRCEKQQCLSSFSVFDEVQTKGSVHAAPACAASGLQTPCCQPLSVPLFFTKKKKKTARDESLYWPDILWYLPIETVREKTPCLVVKHVRYMVKLMFMTVRISHNRGQR